MRPQLPRCTHDVHSVFANTRCSRSLNSVRFHRGGCSCSYLLRRVRLGSVRVRCRKVVFASLFVKVLQEPAWHKGPHSEIALPTAVLFR